MFERLQQAADRNADRLLMRVIRRLSQSEMPDGVEIEALDDGVRLSGRKLRRRLIGDTRLRNIGR
ncbi:hypothetical protein [Sphingorhabdus sp.]|uniref:hypothetical protein n=1 Tax=Sphingorhabdus sp. TaxID=1902408 RepID=UPI0035B26FBC